MSKKSRPFWQRIAIDTLGVLLIIGAVLFGWIPGPGGIPLLIAGLGLLSINHEWAKRLLVGVKTKGTSLYDVFFPDNKWLYLFYDLAGLLLASVSLYFLFNVSGSLTKTLLFALLMLSVGLLLTNRKRLVAIGNLITKIKA